MSAEHAVLGSLMLAPKWIPAIERMLCAADFEQDRERQLFTVIMSMDGKPVDAVSVLDAVLAKGLVRLIPGPYIHELVKGVATAVNVEFHAELVRAASRRRQQRAIGQRIIQIADEVEDPDDRADALARETLALDLMVDAASFDAPIEGLSSWSDFIGKHGGAVRKWIVPGAISASDVWMILAPMGAGKTTLSRQVAWCVAAGINPFNPIQHFTPMRSLVVDLENDPGEAADESAPYLAQVKRLGDFDDDRAQIWEHIEGLNVRKRADAKELERAVVAAKPDIICLGSVNNVYSKGNSDWDTCADEVRSVFNHIRRRYGCALWLEHHMSKSAMGTNNESPYGSMIWSAWATHGRVLSRAIDSPGSPFRFNSPFRGDRGKRDMPVGFTRGGKLPWSSIFEPAELELLTEAATRDVPSSGR